MENIFDLLLVLIFIVSPYLWNNGEDLVFRGEEVFNSGQSLLFSFLIIMMKVIFPPCTLHWR